MKHRWTKQAVKTYIDTWTGSLKGDVMDTKKDFREAVVNKRNDPTKNLTSHSRLRYGK
jgi:hypothetical protein